MTDRELIDRASRRCDWAGRALEGAAQDLHDAALAGAPVDGTAARVLDEAGRVSRLAENIASGERRKANIAQTSSRMVENRTEPVSARSDKRANLPSSHESPR